MKIEDKRYFAEAAPSVGNFESMIAKYEALGKKMVLTSDNKKEGDEVGRQYAKDLKGLNRILQAVKSSDRKTAQQVADNMDSAATDYIPKSLYNWIYKGFSSRAGTKAKFGEPTEYGSFTTKGGQTFNLGYVENNDKTITLYMEGGSGNVVKTKICKSWEDCQFWMKEIARKYGAVKQEVYSRQGSKAKFASMWTDGHDREARSIHGLINQLFSAIEYKERKLQQDRQAAGQAQVLINRAIEAQSPEMINQAIKIYDKANYSARSAFSHKGTKSKFSTRGAFAEASSSPMLGELLQKKVMPEGGWRAVETGSGAITIAFEDPDIAENFAKRCAENGYSATRPAITAARYFNVCVSEEGKKNETN
jgi:hypothetical protein